MYNVVVNMAERKESVASMVRMREVMRLNFYQFLFLKKQSEVEGKERERKNGWKVCGLWKRWAGSGEGGREVEWRGLLKMPQSKIPKL